MFTPRAHQLEPTFFRISTLSNFFMNLYFWRRLNPMMRRSETLRAAETQIPQSACPTSSYRPRAAPPAGTDCALASLPLLREIHVLELPQALAKILNPPQPHSLTMLKHPGVEDGE